MENEREEPKRLWLHLGHAWHGPGHLIKASVQMPINEKAVLLERLRDALRKGDDLKGLAKEFPENALVLEALQTLLGRYGLKEVSDIYWDSTIGQALLLELGM